MIKNITYCLNKIKADWAGERVIIRGITLSLVFFFLYLISFFTFDFHPVKIYKELKSFLSSPTFWTAISGIGAFAAAFAAYYSSKKANENAKQTTQLMQKQLTIDYLSKINSLDAKEILKNRELKSYITQIYPYWVFYTLINQYISMGFFWYFLEGNETSSSIKYTSAISGEIRSSDEYFNSQDFEKNAIHFLKLVDIIYEGECDDKIFEDLFTSIILATTNIQIQKNIIRSTCKRKLKDEDIEKIISKYEAKRSHLNTVELFNDTSRKIKAYWEQYARKYILWNQLCLLIKSNALSEDVFMGFYQNIFIEDYRELVGIITKYSNKLSKDDSDEKLEIKKQYEFFLEVGEKICLPIIIEKHRKVIEKASIKK